MVFHVRLSLYSLRKSKSEDGIVMVTGNYMGGVTGGDDINDIQSTTWTKSISCAM